MDLDNSQLPTPDSQHDYCRHVENYLYRRNGGHLIQIVGPRFELVLGWSMKGIPIKVVERGIDRCIERRNAKKIASRRPVPIEFCEADVLDAFDEWRRAVGIAPAAATPHRTDSLPAHLERIVARLTALRAGEDRSLDDAVEAIVREIDTARAGARTMRGDAREQLLARLRTLDAMLLDAARRRCDAATLQRLGEEADGELAAYRDRMPADAYAQSHAACVNRLIRDRAKLPILTFE